MTPGRLVVRPTRPGDDLERAGRLVHQAYVTLPDYPVDPDYDEQLARVADRLEHGTVVVALLGDEIVGCLTFVPDSTGPLDEFDDPSYASVRMFGVDPSVQGCGVGRAMLQWCIDEARRLGRAHIGLHTVVQMRAASRLYESLGFERVPALDLDFEGEPGLAYVLRL